MGLARPSKRERSYAPRLTAASYKYFVRGMNVKATENDVVVQARRRANLKPYDKLLKAFRCVVCSPDELTFSKRCNEHVRGQTEVSVACSFSPPGCDGCIWHAGTARRWTRCCRRGR